MDQLRESGRLLLSRLHARTKKQSFPQQILIWRDFSGREACAIMEHVLESVCREAAVERPKAVFSAFGLHGGMVCAMLALRG